MEELKKIMMKAQKFDDILENLQNIEKHTKGFMYDSLVCRYQLARYKAIQVDIHEGMTSSAAKSLYERDIMRFTQILDEAMGEHD